MKRYTTQLLMVLNLALVGVLVWLWVDQNGRLRDVSWAPPVAIKPDFSAAPRASAQPPQTDMSLALATLERPLFSPSRRPPPPVVEGAVEAASPPDPLGNVLIQGIYAGAETGGIIASVGGVSKRVAINEKIGEWTLKAIDGRDVKFVRNDEIRVVQLLRASPGQAMTTPSATSNSSAPQPLSTASQGQISQIQKMEDEARERLRRRNELRIRAGRLPIAQ